MSLCVNLACVMYMYAGVCVCMYVRTLPSSSEVGVIAWPLRMVKYAYDYTETSPRHTGSRLTLK